MSRANQPHSLEAEQAVIGSLLLDNSTLDLITDLLPAHFFRADYRAIFDRIRALILAGKPADVITVSESGVCDLMALNELSMSVLTPRHIAGYAEIVAERSLARELQRIGGEITASVDALTPTVDKIDKAMSDLTALGQKRRSRESVSIEDAVAAFLDRLQAEADGQTEVISTGFRDIDKILAGGLRRGELIVVGGRPKMGKTTQALAIARHIARTYGVLICSQEMPVFELIARHASALGRVQLGHIRQPQQMTDAGWGGISDAVTEMQSMAMTLDDQRGLTLQDVRRKVMEAKRKKGCDVVLIDFLQLMTGQGDNRNQELDTISNGLKAMAGEFDVAVVLLSQLSREADKRHGPPVMTDLRDSGAIEAAADVIALLYREYAHPLSQKPEAFKHYAQLEVIQRNGAPGEVPLWFGGAHQEFKNWDGSIPSRDLAKGRGATRRGME